MFEVRTEAKARVSCDVNTDSGCGRSMGYEVDPARHGVPLTTPPISGQRNGFRQTPGLDMFAFTASATTPIGERRKELCSTFMISEGPC